MGGEIYPANASPIATHHLLLTLFSYVFLRIEIQSRPRYNSLFFKNGIGSAEKSSSKMGKRKPVR
jgi:hypothetical protein